MQIVPSEQVKSDGAYDMLIDETALLAVSDPWERARLAAELAAHLQKRSAAVLDVRRDAVRELVVKLEAAPSRVARHLGLTTTRIGQLVRAAARAEHSKTAEAVA